MEIPSVWPKLEDVGCSAQTVKYFAISDRLLIPSAFKLRQIIQTGVMRKKVFCIGLHMARRTSCLSSGRQTGSTQDKLQSHSSANQTSFKFKCSTRE